MDYLELLPIPPKNTFNVGLTSPSNSYMLGLFGHPIVGGAYRTDGKCKPPDEPAFKSRLVARNFGPFTETGIGPAVDSLQSILNRVKTEVPDLYALLGTAGMLCARFTKIRQPDGSIKIGPGVSNHSWGTTIDIKLKGVLDKQGNGLTQRGLLILSTYFNAAEWYWGAAFPTEDAMHFEASKSLLARWKKAGLI